MSEFKVGDKVRVLDISKIKCGANHYFTGMETEVMKINGDWIHLRNTKGGQGISIRPHEIDAIELINTKLTKNQRITTLEETVEQQQNEINELKVLVHQLRNNTTIVAKEYIKSNNELRAEVIENAKSFVEEHKEYGCGSNWKELKVDTHGHCYAEFIINEEKRVIVALIKGLYSNLTTLKGIAKCMPVDVFNEHIGKAIALGRALGLDVSEFEQAVQPNEVVVGTYTHHFKNGELSFEHTVVDEEDAKEANAGQNSCVWTFKIINDTNAIYEVK